MDNLTDKERDELSHALFGKSEPDAKDIEGVLNFMASMNRILHMGKKLREDDIKNGLP